MGGLLLDVPGLTRAAEERSKSECRRLQGIVEKAVGSMMQVEFRSREVVLGAVLDAAAGEARYYDLSIIPWSGDTVLAFDMAQSVVFGSGRPTLLTLPSTRVSQLDHVAVAWDGSRVAARALWDALALLPESGRVTVMTVRDEKPLSGANLAALLAASLEKRGYNATALDVMLGDRSVAAALQDAAIAGGAQLLALGGFGHSRVRDFVLGGATKGVLQDLRLPVLLSH
jgi:nucleotide-binding universal stress UspA family protein